MVGWPLIPGSVRPVPVIVPGIGPQASQEHADTARADADAPDARAQASRDEAGVQIAGIRRASGTALAAARDEASAARAGRDAALALHSAHGGH